VKAVACLNADAFTHFTMIGYVDSARTDLMETFWCVCLFFFFHLTCWVDKSEHTVTLKLKNKLASLLLFPGGWK